MKQHLVLLSLDGRRGQRGSHVNGGVWPTRSRYRSVQRQVVSLEYRLVHVKALTYRGAGNNSDLLVSLCEGTHVVVIVVVEGCV